MKAGWVNRALGEVCHVYQPQTLSQKELKPGPYPVYGANGQIGWHDKYNHESEKLLLGCRGSVGSVHISPPFSWVNGNAMVVEPQEEIVCREYLRYALIGGVEIRAAISGAAQPQITRQSLNPIPISLPTSISEQRRIVALLDEAFADIATAKANAEKNLQNVTSIFENHLQVIFSNDESSRERKTLGSEFATVTGTTPPKSNASFYGAFIPLVKPPELLDDVIESAPDSLTESGAKAARVLPAFSVLVSCIGNLGKIGINTAPVCFNQQINAILPNQAKALPDFMFFQALSPVFKKQLEGLASGTTVPIVNKSKFNSIQIVLPPLEQQANIVEQLKALREETQSLESIYRQKLTALDDLKKSLLHQAFSGQL